MLNSKEEKPYHQLKRTKSEVEIKGMRKRYGGVQIIKP